MEFSPQPAYSAKVLPVVARPLSVNPIIITAYATTAAQHTK